MLIIRAISQPLLIAQSAGEHGGVAAGVTSSL